MPAPRLIASPDRLFRQRSDEKEKEERNGASGTTTFPIGRRCAREKRLRAGYSFMMRQRKGREKAPFDTSFAEALLDEKGDLPFLSAQCA